MGYIYDGKEDNLAYVIDDMFDIMASDKVFNDVSLSSWSADSLVDSSMFRNGNVKELAELIINKASELEKDYGSMNAILIFRDANNKLLFDNEIDVLFDKIESVKFGYKELEVEDKVEIKNKVKLKP